MRLGSLLSALVLVLGLVARPSSLLGADEPVNFGREVLPILSSHCFACHGPDTNARKADLRLDLENEAKAERGGIAVILPGNAEESELIARVGSSDPDEVMPPPRAKKPLTQDQVATLRRWVAQGAKWSKHWSFEPISRPQPPKVENHHWVRSPIDAFVLYELESKGLRPAPPADPLTLARRVSLDVIGLPPTLEQADAFAADPSARSYEKLVDELLRSPRFGEHWARPWLDLARYADTRGYEKDRGRDMWSYRDWVVNALNADMPLDQFTLEQLAGDLLPSPTQDQLIATAFHRNTMTNDEGGTDDEEFRTIAIKDRVDTTLQVWMGLTMGCAKCHSHKYDPITQKDYYRTYALFNQTADHDAYDDGPTLPILTPDQQRRRDDMTQRLAAVRSSLADQQRRDLVRRQAQQALWRPIKPDKAESIGKANLAISDQRVKVSGTRPDKDTITLTLPLSAGRTTAVLLEFEPVLGEKNSFGLGRDPDSPNLALSEVQASLERADQKATPITFTNARASVSSPHDLPGLAVDGKPETVWSPGERHVEQVALILELASPIQVGEKDSTKLLLRLEQNRGKSSGFRQLRVSASKENPSRLIALSEPAQLAQSRQQAAILEVELRDLEQSLAQLPILRELPEAQRRVTKIHNRGSFLDQGEVVEGGVLDLLSPLPKDSPLNRLGVARWLTSPANPLTPRVMANRVWARIFGIGLVETEEDFGSQGMPPSHPKLLDWLAAEYRDDGKWSLKSLIKTIVMSATYQQAYRLDDARREHDPRNLWLSRASRYRLSAEQVRDQALAVGGLLSARMGGPPVMPPQPEGLWKSTYSTARWVTSTGEDRYRRGLYTYWKRTTPYPSMVTFDAGSREVCMVRRISTNTPLQALVTLNDPVYLEAAAGLARRMLGGGGDSTAGRAAFGFRLALIRIPNESEREVVVKSYQDALSDFRVRPGSSAKLLAAANAQPPSGVDADEFAAWTVAASVILNLDELLMRG